jgi:ribonuclease HI
MASNNAMEILAVTEALANIPDGMHLWIVTDSSYVKNGITQWVANWRRNVWKNSGGARVASKSLWETLIAAVDRMRRVEWSWVKAHNGGLLNECADMLATRGVFHEPRPCPVGTIRIRGEDSDHMTYELLDGEETPVAGKDGDAHPLGRTYVLKAGPEVTDPFSVGSLSTPSPVVAEEQVIEACLKETLDLCTRENRDSETVPNPVDQDDDEETFSMPEDTEPRSEGAWCSEECMRQKIARQMKFMADRVEWESWTRPDWWSPAWEGLADARDGNWKRIIPGSPLQFKENMACL